MKTKLANILRGKERNERKNRYAKLNRGKWRFIYIKDKPQGERTVGRANEGINEEKT